MLKYHITRLPIAPIPTGANPTTRLRWQPWQDIETLRQQFDQAFDELTHDPLLKSVYQTPAHSVSRRSPAIELTTTADRVVLTAELPGVAAADLDIQVTRNAVAIQGEYRRETPDEHHQIHRTERRYGRFQRVIGLPVEVDNTQVTAQLQDGLLTLTLPKYQAARHHAVKVSIAVDPAVAPLVEPLVAPDPVVASSVEPAVEPVLEPAVAPPVDRPIADQPGDVWQ